MRAGFLTLFALAAVASAHTKVTHFHVKGVADSKCVRQSISTDPITDLMSPDMACHAVSETTGDKCEVQAGDEVEFEYRVQTDKAPEQVALKDGHIKVGVIDDSHKGPCAVYAKKVDDSATAQGAGDGWFKLSHDGVENGEFCTTRLNNADARLKTTIPTSLAPGDYLLRAEILTLNEADPNAARSPQFYPGCVQVTISGGDSTANPETVSIPGYYDNVESPGLLYNIWTKDDYSDYELPGPAPLAESDTPATETPDNESTAPEEPEAEEPEAAEEPKVEEPEFVEEPEAVEPATPEIELPEIELPEIEVPEIVIPSLIPEPTFSSATIIPTTTFTVPQFTDSVNPSDLPTASPLLPSPTLAPTATAEVAYPTFASDPLPPVSSQVNYTTTVVTVTGTRPTPPGTAGTGTPAAPTPAVPGYKWKYWKKYGGRPRGRGGDRRGRGRN